MKRQDRKLAVLMASQPSSSICDEAGGTDPEQEVRPSKDAVCPDPVKEYQDREGLTDPKAANRSDEPDDYHEVGIIHTPQRSVEWSPEEQKLRSVTHKSKRRRFQTVT